MNFGKHGDLAGKKVRYLTVVRFVGIENVMRHGGIPRFLWLCRCDCGAERIVSSSKLVNNLVRSCGCVRTNKRSRIMRLVSSFIALLLLGSVSLADDDVIDIGVKGLAPGKSTSLQGKALSFSADKKILSLQLQNYMLMKLGKGVAVGWDWHPKTNLPTYCKEKRDFKLADKVSYLEGKKKIGPTEVAKVVKKDKLISIDLDKDGKVSSVQLFVPEPSKLPDLSKVEK